MQTKRVEEEAITKKMQERSWKEPYWYQVLISQKMLASLQVILVKSDINNNTKHTSSDNEDGAGQLRSWFSFRFFLFQEEMAGASVPLPNFPYRDSAMVASTFYSSL